MGLLQMSFAGAVLILAVAVIRAATVNRLPKQTFLILWGVVLFRLLIPVSVPSMFSVYSMIQTILPEKQNVFTEQAIQAENQNLNASQEQTDIIQGEKQQAAGVLSKVADTSQGILTDMVFDKALSDTSSSMLKNALDKSTNIEQKNAISESIYRNKFKDIEGHKEKGIFWKFLINILFGSKNALLKNIQLNTEMHTKICTILSTIWFTGMILSMMAFIQSYLHCRFEFQTALPIQSDFVEDWLKEHPLKRSISIKQFDRIDAPLTYGIFQPIILMPKKTDWSDTKHLQYIFMHEYIHICCFDALKKLLCIAALCVHWFNPFVWLMYFLFNRDMELACDECVVRRFGESSKTIYAQMLIGMEAKKSGLAPFCNHFSKNAIEERIRAIMKIKKKPFGVVLCAAVLVAGITTVFATSASEARQTDEQQAEKTKTDTLFRDAFTDEEYKKLCALRLDGYEDMTISQFQEKEWALTDTKEYRDLMERFDKEEVLYEKKDSDELASFIYDIYEPLTGTQWKTRTYDGAAWSYYPSSIENALMEYTIKMTILEADILTVKEYNNTRLEIIDKLQNTFDEKTVEELADEEAMCEEIDHVINGLLEQFSTEKLQVTVEYIYQSIGDEFLEIYKEDMKQMEDILALYAPFGLTYYYDKEIGYYKMYFQGKEVKGIYDEVEQIWITEHAGIGENIHSEDAIELFTVYENGKLSGLTEGTAAQQEEWAKMRQQTTDNYRDLEAQEADELEEMEQQIQEEVDNWKKWLDRELEPYTAVGLTYQWETDEGKVRMYYQEKEVKGIIDEHKHIWITGNTAAYPISFNENAIELCAVYQDEYLIGLREGTIQERKEWKKLYDAAVQSQPSLDNFNIIEIREYAPATQEDYRALFTLKTSNYPNTSIADFSTMLFDWGAEYADCFDRITCDRIWNDYSVSLSKDEKAFVERTVWLSTIENREIVRSEYTGKAQEDPVVGEIRLEKTAEGKKTGMAWCTLTYQLSYHISDKEMVTVGERDRCVGGIMDEIQEYWDKTSIDELVKMEKEDFIKMLNDLAAKYSNELIRITIEERTGYECIDERDWDLTE